MKATLTMEVPDYWHAGPTLAMVEEFTREANRASLAMHSFHPDVRMSVTIHDPENQMELEEHAAQLLSDHEWPRASSC